MLRFSPAFSRCRRGRCRSPRRARNARPTAAGAADQVGQRPSQISTYAGRPRWPAWSAWRPDEERVVHDAPASAPTNRPMVSLVGRRWRSARPAVRARRRTTRSARRRPGTCSRSPPPGGTGVASRCMMLPSSTSAPSTLVPMISAVSGSTTENPKMPRTWRARRRRRVASLSSADTPSRISARDREQQGPLAAQSPAGVDRRRPVRPNIDATAFSGRRRVSAGWRPGMRRPGRRRRFPATRRRAAVRAA